MLPEYKDYIRLLRESVIYAPVVKDREGKEIKCKRPSSFAYIERIEELSSPGKGAGHGKGKTYWFDRDKAVIENPNAQTETSTPIVAITERTFQFDEIFSENEKHTLSNAKIFILDVLNHKTCSSGYCKNRHPVEVFQDCSEIYVSIISYLKNVSCYEYDEMYLWLNSDNYKWLVQNDKETEAGDLISLYEERREYKATYLQYLKMRNKDILGRTIQWEGSGGLYGLMVDLNLPMLPCLTIEHSFKEYPETVVGKPRV